MVPFLSNTNSVRTTLYNLRSILILSFHLLSHLGPSFLLVTTLYTLSLPSINLQTAPISSSYRVLISGRSKGSSRLQGVWTDSCAQPASYLTSRWGCIPGMRRSGREANHSHLLAITLRVQLCSLSPHMPSCGAQ